MISKRAKPQPRLAHRAGRPLAFSFSDFLLLFFAIVMVAAPSSSFEKAPRLSLSLSPPDSYSYSLSFLEI
jgi:hypothetical protein